MATDGTTGVDAHLADLHRRLDHARLDLIDVLMRTNRWGPSRALADVRSAIEGVDRAGAVVQRLIEAGA